MSLPIIKIEKAASSNSEAMVLAKQKNLPEGTVVWVLNQTMGRGQGNKKWLSNPGENLTFSILLKPAFLSMEKQFLLSKMVAVAVAKVISCFCSDTFIKWPNDIYVNNNKIAGILIENTIQGRQMFNSVIGIGVNINQENFPAEIPNPTSLYIETKQQFKLESLLSLIQETVIEEYEKLKKGQFEPIENFYDSLLYKKNQTVPIIHRNKVYNAVVKEVDTSGFLYLLIDNKEVSFSVGEIEFLSVNM